jgi:hypothetical protein
MRVLRQVPWWKQTAWSLFIVVGYLCVAGGASCCRLFVVVTHVQYEKSEMEEE